jgi:hypothetical protein
MIADMRSIVVNDNNRIGLIFCFVLCTGGVQSSMGSLGMTV